MTQTTLTGPPKPEARRWIIAIDGPAASGKGTLARRIADTLGFAHLDTGALYRAVAYEVLQSGGDPTNPEHATTAAQKISQDIILHNAKPEEGSSLDKPKDLTNPRLKDDDVGQAASKVASIPEVRAILLDLQQNFATNPPPPAKGAVLDGRDIGTVICPNADIKLFIEAKTEIRADRRFKELQSRGKDPIYEAVLKDMRERDARDQGRQTAPMMPADDALIIDTGHLNAKEAFEEAMALIRENLPHI